MSGQDFDRGRFAGAVGSTFVVDPEGTPVTMVLDRIADGPSQPGYEQYALTFRGPGDPVLAQQTFRIDHEGLGTMSIFLVPVGRVGDQIEYEACFNYRSAGG